MGSSQQSDRQASHSTVLVYTGTTTQSCSVTFREGFVVSNAGHFRKRYNRMTGACRGEYAHYGYIQQWRTFPSGALSDGHNKYGDTLWSQCCSDAVTEDMGLAWCFDRAEV